MKSLKSLLTILLTLCLVAFPILAVSARTQDPQSSALARGYRTGYSDGYSAGLNDAASSAARDVRSKTDYQHADRGYNSSYGSLEDFRDGYQQGFEAGYNAGYEHREFDSTVPSDLSRKGAQPDNPVVNTPSDVNASVSVNTGNPPNGPLAIPRDTVMRVELTNNLSTDASQRGDRFQARVMEPREYEGATVDGHVTEVKRPGKAKGTALLQLSFDHIQMPDGRSSNMSAQVIEVIPMRRRESWCRHRRWRDHRCNRRRRSRRGDRRVNRRGRRNRGSPQPARQRHSSVPGPAASHSHGRRRNGSMRSFEFQVSGFKSGAPPHSSRCIRMA